MKINRGKPVVNITEVIENMLIRPDKYISLRTKAWQDFFSVVGAQVLKRGVVIYLTIHTTIEGCGEQFPTSKGVVFDG